MEIKPIKTKTAYRAALKEIDSLMMARPNTAEGDRLDVLVTLVEAYERKHLPTHFPAQSMQLNFAWGRNLFTKCLINSY